MTIRHLKNGTQHILYCESCEDVKSYPDPASFNGDLFNPAYLKKHQLIYRTAQGRGNSYFFNYCQQQWVLRHYWRGGWIAKINRDAYLWQPLQNTRAYRELSLLRTMQHWQLPVPKPIAAQIIYHMGFYRADIITGAIACSQSLLAALENNLSKSQWQKIGQTIKNFHRYGIYHDDLNAQNILLNDEDAVFLIDFDKAKIRSRQENSLWMQKNLMRLLRSLRKQKNKNPSLNFTEKNWKELIEGYKRES